MSIFSHLCNKQLILEVISRLSYVRLGQRFFPSQQIIVAFAASVSRLMKVCSVINTHTLRHDTIVIHGFITSGFLFVQIGHGRKARIPRHVMRGSDII